MSDEAERLLESIHPESRVFLTPSCTSALEITALLLELEEGDEVIVPSFAFTSTANAFVLAGARIRFADVSLDTYNMCFECAKKLVTPKTRAICLINYSGVAEDLEKFVTLAEENGIMLIEDNAHGLGAMRNYKTLGTFGGLSTLSFHETKNVTCGEGGALVVNNMELVERVRVLRDKGTNRANFLLGQIDEYTWVDKGSSWVLAEAQSALLYSQLLRFEKIQGDREQQWRKYANDLQAWAALNNVALPFDYNTNGSKHSSHIFSIRFLNKSIRDLFIDYMKKLGISVVFHYQALHQSPYSLSRGWNQDHCPNSLEIEKTMVRLPMGPHLSQNDQNKIIDAILNFLPNSIQSSAN
jgi:dTDP-4-amino-4,6-dideoxygalactose transaminase